MFILIILNVVVTIAYSIMAIVHKKGVPDSLSETSYYWNYKFNPFTFYCISVVLLLFLPWLSASPSFHYLAFLSMAGLLAAGSTPMFLNEKFQLYLHWFGGVSSLIFAVLWMLFNGFWIWVLLSLLLIIILCFIYSKAWIFWTEIITILCLCFVLIFYIIV